MEAPGVPPVNSGRSAAHAPVTLTARRETADPCTPVPAPMRNAEVMIAAIVVRGLSESADDVTSPDVRRGVC